MSLVGITSKAAYMAGKSLPGLSKTIALKAHTLTLAKTAAITGHVLLTTAKVAGAGIAAILASSWIGL